MLAPSLFAFSGAAATLCYVVGAAQIALSLITRYPMGAVKWLSFPAHGAYELGLSLFLVASPWLFNFDAIETPRNFLVFSGVLLFGVWATTDYRRLAVDAVGATERYPRSTTSTFPGSSDRPRPRDAA